MQVVQVEQVSSAPNAEDDRSLHTPPIKLTAEGFSSLPPQEISATPAVHGQRACQISKSFVTFVRK